MNAASKPLSILFFGTPDIAATSLRALLEDNNFSVKLVVTQPDRPAGRGAALCAPPVKVLAESRSIPVLQPLSVKKGGPQFLGEVSTFGPFDIGVVVAFGQILPIEILELPRSGSVNVHTSLLPRWRGAAPMQRAILAGDKETGVCLMRMEAGLDTGPVYCSESTLISDQDTFATLHDRLAAIGAHLLRTKLPAIASGSVVAKPQQPTEGVTYASKVTNEEARIDWSKSCSEVSRQIRAFSPAPGAFTFLNGKRLKIYRTQVATSQSSLQAPGTLQLERETILIHCGDGLVAIEELQLEGKKRIEAKEFLRGFNVTAGLKLG